MVTRLGSNLVLVTKLVLVKRLLTCRDLLRSPCQYLGPTNYKSLISSLNQPTIDHHCSTSIS